MKLSKNYIRENLVLCILILKKPWVLKKGNLDFDRLRELEKWSNGLQFLYVAEGHYIFQRQLSFKTSLWSVN